MKRTRVKVCGMRKPGQVGQLVDLGIDAIGMIFYASSPRHVTLEEAKDIRAVVPPFVSLTGVFVNTEAYEVNRIAKEVGLNVVQLHGDQDSNFAKQLAVPYIRAIRVDSKETIIKERLSHINANGFLLDTFSKNAYGGTGNRIQSDLLPSDLSEDTILAGGINPSNILEILEHKPYAVDINSGVEFAPADKNIDAVRSIIETIRKFDSECS